MKKAFFRGLSCLLSICLLATLLPVGILAAETSTKATEANLLRLGRTYEKDGAICLDWSHSGVSFNFTGTGAKAVMTATNNNGFVNVYVDGALAPTKVLALTQKDTPVTYTLAENLPAGNHTVTLRKRNEAAYGGSATIGLTDVIVTDGALTTPPVMPDRRIEVIGDSITAGHGNLAGSTNVGYSHAVSDGTASYATLTAAALNAEIDVIARSGIRFVQAGDNGDSMYPVYDKVVGLGNKCTDTYDFAANEKDVVIINLGTNDNGARDENGVSVTDDFVQSEAKAFLQLVRQKNPNAEIVWAYGIMGSSRSSAIKAAIAELNAAGDSKISFYALDVIDGKKEGYGSGNHPTVITAINRSFGLAEYIGQKMGWSDIRYDAQLAWQLQLANAYDGAYLSTYSSSSINDLKATIAQAKALQTPTNEQIKTAVDAIQTAHMNLELRIEEVSMLSQTELSKTGHQITFDYDMDVDVTPYAGRQLYFSYETKIETTQTPTTDKWLSYVRNGYAFTTDGDAVRTQITSGRNYNSIKEAAHGWVKVLLPLTNAAVSNGTIKHLQMYYFNDTGNMSEEDKEGLSWSNNSGVTIRVRNMRLVAEGTPVYPDVIAYSYNAVTDFGADPTGQNDATAAIQNAINAAAGENGGIVYLPEGQYKVLGNLNIPGGVSLRGDWENPTEGGLGKGTVLMAYAGRGTTTYTPHFDGNASGTPFIKVNSGAVLRGVSVWYPEQTADNIQPYPATIEGSGHADVADVTLYNSYYGYYNNDCSSMLIRGLYGTVLSTGIHGAYAYDIPRIENIYFDTAYWANSGFANAPTGESLNQLNAYTEANLIAIQAGEQDWGYWYDLNVNHAKYAIYLTTVLDNNKAKMVPGNIAAGLVDFRNVQVGVYAENAGYPGFQLTYGSISAFEYGFYIPLKPDYTAFTDNGINPAYYENASYAISDIDFTGGVHNLYAAKTGKYGITVNDCTFAGTSDVAIRMDDGSLVCSNSRFDRSGTPLTVSEAVNEVVLLGNTFADDWQVEDSRIIRDDADTSVPHTPAFDYGYDFNDQPIGSTVINVKSYSAVSGTLQSPPTVDSTAAFQATVDAVAAAGGGVAYVPGGTYRIDGALTIPTGVELRGTFESAHYGNSTEYGSQLLVYGATVPTDAQPLITLEENAGVKGLSVFYPDQGFTDDPSVETAKQIKAYPPTVRANKNTWVQYLSVVGCYTAIDAITNNCDNIVITDVTGAAMYATLEMGHGTTGGHVQNLHFNYSGWTHQGYYKNKPNGDAESALFNDYTTRVVKGLILGDCRDVQFLSCFNILVAEQIVLQKDPYTGGSFDGTMWGVAFDAAGYGVVARDGCDAHLDIVASMGVFNQQGGGYNVLTKPGFTGEIGLYNADAWGNNSQLVYVEGGTVNLCQYFSWTANNGYCGEGATVNLSASLMIGDFGNTPHIVFADGASGSVVGTVSCVQKMNVNVRPGADVTLSSNGQAITVSENTGLVFSDMVATYTATDGTVDTDWVLRDRGSLTGGVNLAKRKNSSALRLRLIISAPSSVAGLSGRVAFSSVGDGIAYFPVASLNLKQGQNSLLLPLGDMMDDSLDWTTINRLRITLENAPGISVTVEKAEVIDTLSLNTAKYELKQYISHWDTSGYTPEQLQQYNALVNQVNAMLADEAASVNDVNNALQTAVELKGALTGNVDKTDLLKLVRQQRQAPPMLGLYTRDSVAAYQNALDGAVAILTNESATADGVETAENTLAAAIAALEVLPAYTVFSINQNWDVANGAAAGNVSQFYHNWRGFEQGNVDLTPYDPDCLVLRFHLRLGLGDNSTQTALPSTLTVTSIRLAIRSNGKETEETSLLDATILKDLHWGDNMVEIPFSLLKNKDSGTTDWSQINNLLLYYNIAEMQGSQKGDYIAELDHLCLVNTAVEDSIGKVAVVGNGRLDITGDMEYGTANILTPVMSDDAGSRFAGWWINNSFRQLIENRSTALTVMATKNERVTGYFLEGDERVVVFYGKYNQVIDVQVATSIDDLKVPTPPTLDGYINVGWDTTLDDMLFLVGDQDVISVTAVYNKDPAASLYTITLINSVRVNGTQTADLWFDTGIQAEAQPPAEGMKFSHWELDGMYVGADPTYTFYVSGNNTLKAVYVAQDAGAYLPQLSAAVKKVALSEVAQGQYTVSFICQTYLPADYTLMEYGAFIAPQMDVLKAVQQGTAQDNGYLVGRQYLQVISSSRVPNRQYLITLENMKENRTRYAMAYIIACDADGNVKVVYSPIVTVSTVPVTDDNGIGSPDEVPDPFG